MLLMSVYQLSTLNNVVLKKEERREIKSQQSWFQYLLK